MLTGVGEAKRTAARCLGGSLLSQRRISALARCARLSLAMLAVLAPFGRMTPLPYLDSVVRPCRRHFFQSIQLMVHPDRFSAWAGLWRASAGTPQSGVYPCCHRL